MLRLLLKFLTVKLFRRKVSNYNVYLRKDFSVQIRTGLSLIIMLIANILTKRRKRDG